MGELVGDDHFLERCDAINGHRNDQLLGFGVVEPGDLLGVERKEHGLVVVIGLQHAEQLQQRLRPCDLLAVEVLLQHRIDPCGELGLVEDRDRRYLEERQRPRLLHREDERSDL